MTYQIKDVVRFRGGNYFIAGCSTRTFPFYPKDEGIEVISATTANYRGFYCRYVVENESLSLLTTTLYLCEDQYAKVLKGNAHELFGCIAEPVQLLFYEKGIKGFLGGKTWGYDEGYIRYNNIWQVIPFTGGLLVGRNEDSVYGTFSARLYDELWEIVFESGKMVAAFDRSEMMKSWRDWCRARMSETKGSDADEEPDGVSEVDVRLRSIFTMEYNRTTYY